MFSIMTIAGLQNYAFVKTYQTVYMRTDLWVYVLLGAEFQGPRPQSHTLAFFILFWERVQLLNYPGGLHAYDPPSSATQVTGIIGIYHHAQMRREHFCYM